MSNRLNIPEVAELLAERTGRKREEAERFLRLLVEAITEGVLQDQLVKVKGVGTFKLIEVEARESVHVHTGNRDHWRAGLYRPFRLHRRGREDRQGMSHLSQCIYR